MTRREASLTERNDHMKKLALLLALAPLLASAQTPPSSPARPAGPMMHHEEDGPSGPMDPARKEKLQRRIQLALTLGLAEALQLDDAAALKVRGQIEKFSPRRMAAAEQMRDSVQVLRRSAKGDKVPAAEVDAAITRLLDARAQMQVIDRELVTTITRDLPPEKRARGVLFLAKFHQRMMEELRPGGHGRRGPGGPGGLGGPGAGPGRHGPGQVGMNEADLDAGWDDGAGGDES
jgi:hypothetical protein